MGSALTLGSSVRTELNYRTPSCYPEIWRIDWRVGKNLHIFGARSVGVKPGHKGERGIFHPILCFMHIIGSKRRESSFSHVLDQTQLKININIYCALLPQEMHPHTSVFCSHSSPLR